MWRPSSAGELFSSCITPGEFEKKGPNEALKLLKPLTPPSDLHWHIELLEKKIRAHNR